MERGTYKTMTNLETANYCPSLPERRPKKKEGRMGSTVPKICEIYHCLFKVMSVIIRTCQCRK